MHGLFTLSRGLRRVSNVGFKVVVPPGSRFVELKAKLIHLDFDLLAAALVLDASFIMSQLLKRSS